jgi:hypothetical protein
MICGRDVKWRSGGLLLILKVKENAAQMEVLREEKQLFSEYFQLRFGRLLGLLTGRQSSYSQVYKRTLGLFTVDVEAK